MQALPGEAPGTRENPVVCQLVVIVMFQIRNGILLWGAWVIRGCDATPDTVVAEELLGQILQLEQKYWTKSNSFQV